MWVACWMRSRGACMISIRWCCERTFFFVVRLLFAGDKLLRLLYIRRPLSSYTVRCIIHTVRVQGIAPSNSPRFPQKQPNNAHMYSGKSFG